MVKSIAALAVSQPRVCRTGYQVCRRYGPSSRRTLDNPPRSASLIPYWQRFSRSLKAHEILAFHGFYIQIAGTYDRKVPFLLRLCESPTLRRTRHTHSTRYSRIDRIRSNTALKETEFGSTRVAYLVASKYLNISPLCIYL